MIKEMNNTYTHIATLAGGCFWCTEAVFQRVEGVISVTPGYTAGNTKNPTYSQICSGNTGHAEAVEIAFDSKKVSYESLLHLFFATHNPTTLNRQGNDVGTQYRSAIFYHDLQQKETALAVINALTQAQVYDSKIVTEIGPATVFYKAEIEHQNYYNQHQSQPYCQWVIKPKIEKLNSLLGDIKRG